MVDITLTPERLSLRRAKRTFGAQLRDLMALSNMSIDQLAKSTGIGGGKIMSYRISGTLPKVLDAIAMAKALGVSVELLITGEEV